jgi:hypothetical protein
MRRSIATLEATSPLDHNIESVLPGVHTKLSSMQAEMADGFRTSREFMERWEADHAEREGKMSQMTEQNTSVAAQLIRIAATLTGSLGRGAEVAADGVENSNANANTNSQPQATAAASEDDLFQQATRFLMAPRHMSLQTIYFEWHGLETSKDKPIVGGFQRCEDLFKSKWRKRLNFGENKQFSRLKRIMGGIQDKATTDGIDLETVVDNLAPIYEKECKKSIAKMETWMVTNGMIPKGKSRETGSTRT